MLQILAGRARAYSSFDADIRTDQHAAIKKLRNHHAVTANADTAARVVPRRPFTALSILRPPLRVWVDRSYGDAIFVVDLWKCRGCGVVGDLACESWNEIVGYCQAGQMLALSSAVESKNESKIVGGSLYIAWTKFWMKAPFFAANIRWRELSETW
jgi:hypothetical protein